MHPHRMDDRCSVKHLSVGNPRVATTGVLTHRQEHETSQLPLRRAVGSSRCLCLASAPPWERLPEISKSRNLSQPAAAQPHCPRHGRRIISSSLVLAQPRTSGSRLALYRRTTAWYHVPPSNAQHDLPPAARNREPVQLASWLAVYWLSITLLQRIGYWVCWIYWLLGPSTSAFIPTTPTRDSRRSIAGAA
jgi:hypothetical protein